MTVTFFLNFLSKYHPLNTYPFLVGFFIGTLVSAWRVSVADGGDIWYVPVIMALASAAMTVGALQHRKRKVTQNED